MADRFRIVRAEDMAFVELELVNVEVAADGGTLIRSNTNPATVFVHLPPQHISERVWPRGGNIVDGYPWAWIYASAPSRIAFVLPPGADSVPLGPDGVLGALRDGLLLDPTRTEFELPRGLLLRPAGPARWIHSSGPVVRGGRTELWQSRIVGHAGASTTPGVVHKTMPIQLRAVGVREVAMSTKPTSEQLAQIVRLTGGGDGVDPRLARPLTGHPLLLSALGATTRLGGHWPELPVGTPSTPTVERYEHVVSGGRDQHVTVVERGYLSSGHRAARVQVTEREFEWIDTDRIVASLRQHDYIVVTQPELDLEPLDAGYPHQGREMPLRRIVITSTRTPDLPDGTRPDVFWVPAGQWDVHFAFDMVGVDWDGNRLSFSMQLVFIAGSAIMDEPLITNVLRQGGDDHFRRPFAGQTTALVPTGSAESDGTNAVRLTHFTFEHHFVSRDEATPLPADYGPRFVLSMRNCEVMLDAIQQLAEPSAPSAGSRPGAEPRAHLVTLHPNYLRHGMAGANKLGAYLALDDPVALAFRAEQIGGIASPNTTVDVVTTAKGLISGRFLASADGSAPVTWSGLFDQARLFGIVKLADVLGVVDGRPPEPPQLAQVRLPDRVEIRYEWRPPLMPGHSRGIRIDRGATMHLRSVLVRRLTGGGDTTEVSGELTGFAFDLGLVQVAFTRLAFTATAGRKPDVVAEGTTVTFTGALRFVDTLKSILPSTGFSAPRGIEVGPTGITAGYTLGVPSVGVGIFSISNIALSAGLTISFTGKPATVRFAISDRHHPFTVAVALFGGGGFFALVANSRGIEQIEASIEFGGVVELNLGVASGGVSVMAGVYFGLRGESLTLTGYVRCRGHLSVLGLVSISVEFYLGLTYRDKGGDRGELCGQASVTVSVRIAFFSKSITLTVERRFAGEAGDPTFEDCVDPADWDQYCLAYSAAPGVLG